MSAVRHVIVAIPARNEERLLPRCLRSIRAAQRHLALHEPGVSVHLMVALDSCTDRSADIVGRFREPCVELSVRSVGRARDAAVSTALRGLSAGATGGTTSGDAGMVDLTCVLDLSQIWIANTDADSQVPGNWLTAQVALARRGVDLMLGTTEPQGADPSLLALWRARHTFEEGHPHVHGANLGMRATVWRDAGGFGPLETHEDVELVRRAKRDGVHWVATDLLRVRTSARTVSRVDGGFADYLRDLVTGLPTTTAVR